MVLAFHPLMVSLGRTLASATLRSLPFLRRHQIPQFFASPSSSLSAHPRFSGKVLASQNVPVTIWASL
jgi:hypothetical protein